MTAGGAVEKRANFRFPLNVHIATLFIGLILIMAIVLGWFNYQQNSRILLSATEKLYDQIAGELGAGLQSIYRPIVGMVDVLADSEIMSATSLEERLAGLHLFSRVIAQHEQLAALSVGYGSGDFFIARSLRTEEMRGRFSAPAGASLMIDSVVTGDAGEPRPVRLFFNSGLDEIGRVYPDDSGYDPRTRSWYQVARDHDGTVTVPPYLYYFMRKVGVTVSRSSSLHEAVFAADITLEALSRSIAEMQVSPSAELLLMNADGEVLAYSENDRIIVHKDDQQVTLARVTDLESPVLHAATRGLEFRKQSFDFESDGRDWLGSVTPVGINDATAVYLMIVAPKDELLAEAMRIRNQSLLMRLLVLLLSLPVAWWLASRVARPLRMLARETGLIRRFDFQSPISTRSRIIEVDDLAVAMDMMKSTISRFIELINSLAAEQDFDHMLHSISHSTLQVSGADLAGIYLVDEDGGQVRPVAVDSRNGSASPGTPRLPGFALDGASQDGELAECVRRREVCLNSISRETAATGSINAILLGELEAERADLACIPLQNRNDEVVGALFLVFREDPGELNRDGLRQERIAFLQALSGFAAVSIESRHLLKLQKDLLEAFIKLIAAAIDAKSPYTGGHCQRVPELTKMLAQAACDVDSGPFRDFSLDSEQWEALHIAAWLHDCGKVTTPEYVVDKSTKLETIYDRIHEIRMRFEVLKRDAEIACWKSINDGADRNTALETLAGQLSGLDDEFAFIAKCNEGGEFMSDEDVARVRQIARRTWSRTLDDRLGVSREERHRKSRQAAQDLPVDEFLLADKDEHLVERDTADRMPVDNPWGFRLDVPEHKYNRGEIYNLCIRRGTLSAEERYKINDHIVQTIIMLDKLPYPKHLKAVPDIAGGHHEKMDGTGYPRQLQRDDMSLTARMMAIADIFEALTASDRPYKKAKTVGEALKIMSLMRQDRHIDPELFELFLTAGVYKWYAERFLSPGQLDGVDISQYL
jgi:HD-GYP domain-containing protein (c-di-GMP phosphodiesterase class II)